MEQALPTFAHLLGELPELATTLRQADKYLAHTPRAPQEPSETLAQYLARAETLAQHMARVMLYFSRLTTTHGLDAVADRLAIASIPASIGAEDRLRIAEEIKRLVVQAIWQHDFGKVNEQFQQARMNNPVRADEPVVKHDFKHHHSLIGAYLYVINGLQTLRSRESGKGFSVLAAVLLALSYAIEKHHSPRLGENLLAHDSFQGRISPLTGYLPRYGLALDATQISQWHLVMGKGYQAVAKINEKLGEANDFALYALVRLTFSLLTAADYYGTNHFSRGWDDAHPYDDFGLITGELREKIIQNARTRQPYNRQVTEHLAAWLAQDPTQAAWQVPNADNLNKLRSRMAAEVVANVRQHAHQRLFYLHAPTGGGKTNLSMLAAAELLAANPELTKIYYVFPFTTLITQTAQALRESLGLTGDEVVQLHSRAAYQDNEADPELDARYGREHRTELDNLFVNFPVCLLTHVRFVDLLKTSRKEANYLLHRLANSVVILDELQSYDPRHWDKLAWLFEEYARAFNMRFVLMSATLPRLSDLKIGAENYVRVPFQELLPAARQRFFLNPNFGQRVRFDFSLEIELTTPDRKDEAAREAYLTDLAGHVRDQSEAWAAGNGGRVRTVIEFIFKKTATEFQKLINDKDLLPGYVLLVLSGTILESRRRAIIYFLKNQPADCPKVLLITTQVVEAGVDIDMDLGFKDRSLLDSEEQLAGRVNRNATKAGSVLYLFRLDSAKLLYGHDKRYGVQESSAFRGEAAEILASKDFDKLYGEVMRGIDAWNAKAGGVNLGTYQDYCRRLNFPAVDDNLKLIDQETQTVFVPCEIGIYPAIYVQGKWRQPEIADFSTTEKWHQFSVNNRLLTDAQLEFLFEHNINTQGGLVHGRDVLKLFSDLEEPKAESNQVRAKKKQNQKKLQGILALFTISMFANSSEMKQLQRSHRAYEKGYFWALVEDKMEEIYTLDGGFLTEQLQFEDGSVFF